VTVANPASGRKIAVLPLAVTLAVHLLLAACLIATATRRPAREAARQLVSVLVRVSPLPEPPPAPTPRPASPAPSKARSATPPPPAPALVHDAPAQAPADKAPAAPLTLTSDEFLSSAKKQAGAIDRELRGGKSGVPAQADTPWGRFQRALAGAYNDRSRTTVMETYTSPDGVQSYRFRQGDKVWCRRSGGVGPDMGYTEGQKLAGAGSAGSARTAGLVECPSGDPGWRR
jgi:hypothetical protein